MDFTEYIRPELLILVPVLYFIGVAFKHSKIKDKLIPIFLGCVGIVMSAVWLFSVSPISGYQDVFTLIFAAVTQGIICAAASVYVNQVYKQIKEGDDEK